MVVDRMRVLALPWVFSQSHPLSTSDVITEAGKRGVELNAPTLRELYRHGDLRPLAQLTDRRVTDSISVAAEGPSLWNGRVLQLRRALASGRVRDLAVAEFRSRARFDERRMTDPRGWWNGLVYSRWQLLVLPDLNRRLADRRVRGHSGRPLVTMPPLNKWSVQLRERIARWALILTALEPRYLPEVTPEWLSPVNVVSANEWEEFRGEFNPIEMAELLEVAPGEIAATAESFLSRARGLDGSGDWAKLVRRARPRSWKSLTGDVLIALDYRLAAEILLLFYEDLAARGAADPLPEISATVWHPRSDRLSNHGQELDSLLTDLGVSPHPGAVLMVEGEVEELIVPRVFDRLGLRRTPDLVRVLCMRSADRDLALVAAATAAPLLGEQRNGAYEMIRPPTRLIIAIDQDKRWDSEDKVANERRKILDEIAKVVRAQGGNVPRDELDGLVIVRPWNDRCFEFAHFSDDELADAMIEIHHDCGGLDRQALIGRIREKRKRGLDIKAVWDQEWRPQPSKPALADALWPVLAAKIDQLRAGVEIAVPAVVEVVHEAYLLAQQSRLGTFVIRAASSETKD